jgi:hypothetical protein
MEEKVMDEILKEYGPALITILLGMGFVSALLAIVPYLS